MVELVSDYYDQDLVQPKAIFHGFDFGLPEGDGAFGYIYNFLDYYFEEDGVQINARHYLDDVGKASVSNGDLQVLRTDFGIRVLMFLFMRYRDIDYPGPETYKALPNDLLETVGVRLTTHMQTTASDR
jgi:hypothetical protein